MLYSISDLEQLSGIQSHTIRMWEQRYNALVPHRSAGNTRYYDDKQLLRLLNIVSISKQGLKISKICSLSDDAIRQLIDNDIRTTISSDQQYEFYITKLLKHGIAYDEANFSSLVDECFAKYNVAVSYQYIIYPMLTRLGLMWRKDSVCAGQEHFLTNIIRRKLDVEIDRLPLPKNGRTWLLFLPEEEEHELGLLYANYAIRKLGQRVIYLGTKVPLQSLRQASEVNQIDHMLMFIIQYNLLSPVQRYVDELSANYPGVSIHLAGNQNLFANLNLPNNVSLVKSIDQFEMEIQSANLC
ncbi:MAG: MerR family transcriptional regulator [Bacteroidia bacterium]